MPLQGSKHNISFTINSFESSSHLHVTLSNNNWPSCLHDDNAEDNDHENDDGYIYSNAQWKGELQYKKNFKAKDLNLTIWTMEWFGHVR